MSAQPDSNSSCAICGSANQHDPCIYSVLSPSVIIALRGRRGLKEEDDSQDRQILAMSPTERFRRTIGWYFGDEHRADSIVGWARICGLNVTGYDD